MILGFYLTRGSQLFFVDPMSRCDPFHYDNDELVEALYSLI